MAANPTPSTTGARVITLGTGKDYDNAYLLRVYLETQNLVTNAEMLYVEAYEDFGLADGNTYSLAGYDATHYCVIRPVPGLDFKTLESTGPQAFGTAGIKLNFTTGQNIMTYGGIVFEGFRIGITNGGGGYAMRMQQPGRQRGFSKCRISVDTDHSPFWVGESGGAYDLLDSTVIFAATCTSPLWERRENPVTDIKRNTFVRLGTAGYAIDSVANGSVTDNAFINMGGAAFGTFSDPSDTATYSNNVSTNAADARTGFTVVAVGSAIVNEASDLRPKSGGTLVGVASSSANSTIDMLGVSRGSAANVGALQTVAVGPDSTLIVKTGPTTADTGTPIALTFSGNNGFKSGQAVDLTFTGSGFTVSPTTVHLDSTTPSATGAFMFTSVGVKSIVAHSTGTPTLPDLTFSVTASAPVPADAVVIGGATTAVGGAASTITVTVNHALTSGQSVSIALSDADGGTFSPNPALLDSATQSRAISYTPRAAASGSRTVTGVSTGTPTLTSGTSTVTVTPAPPQLLAGINRYEVGTGKQFATMTTLASFLNGKDLIAAGASVFIDVFNNQVMPSTTVAVNTGPGNEIFMRPAAGFGFAALNPNPPRWIPSTGVKLTFSAGDFIIPLGWSIEGFIMDFPGTSALVIYPYGAREAVNGIHRNFITVSNPNASSNIRSGEYAINCPLTRNILIRSAGSGPAVELRDGNGDCLENTFLANGTWSGSSILSCAGFHTDGNVSGNVTQDCGAQPFSISATSTNAKFTGNFTNVAVTGFAASGFTANTTAAFFESSTADLRPSSTSPLLGAGPVAARATNDAYGNNYGSSPDAGAVQRVPAPTLPSGTVTSSLTPNGQVLTVNFNTANSPTSAQATLTPDSTAPDGASANTGVVTFPSSSTGQAVFDNIVPGLYVLNITLFNTGGPGAVTGTGSVRVRGISGTAQASAPSGGITGVAVTPQSVTMNPGDTQQYSASVLGDSFPSQDVTYSASAGTITSSGLYTAPARTSQTQNITITVTSAADPTAYGTGAVTVAAISAPIATVSSVSVTPATSTVQGGSSQTFVAGVVGTNSPPQTVAWSSSAGSVNSGGIFTAPAPTQSIQLVTVTATSTFDTSKSGIATVAVPAAAIQNPTVSSVVVTPINAALLGGAQQQFAAVVLGTFNPSQGVTWTTTGGSITTSGLLTAPAATNSVVSIVVRATSVQDASKYTSVTVVVAALDTPPTVQQAYLLIVAANGWLSGDNFDLRGRRARIDKVVGERQVYGLDLTAWLAARGTTLVGATLKGYGVTIDSQAYIVGSAVMCWIKGGVPDSLENQEPPLNYLTIHYKCANGTENEYTIWFDVLPL